MCLRRQTKSITSKRKVDGKRKRVWVSWGSSQNESLIKIMALFFESFPANFRGTMVCIFSRRKIIFDEESSALYLLCMSVAFSISRLKKATHKHKYTFICALMDMEKFVILADRHKYNIAYVQSIKYANSTTVTNRMHTYNITAIGIRNQTKPKARFVYALASAPTMEIHPPLNVNGAHKN